MGQPWRHFSGWPWEKWVDGVDGINAASYLSVPVMAQSTVVIDGPGLRQRRGVTPS